MKGQAMHTIESVIKRIAEQFHEADIAFAHGTDNAVMGAIALEKYDARQFETLELDIRAGLVR